MEKPASSLNVYEQLHAETPPNPQPVDKPEFNKIKHKTMREKVKPPAEEPRRASQLAMPPPSCFEIKSKPKSKSSQKTSVSDSAVRQPVKALYSDVTKGETESSDRVRNVPSKSTKTTRRIAPPSEFNSNNTITVNDLSAVDNHFHLQLHSTANSSAHDDLTIQQRAKEDLSLLNATDTTGSTYSTIIFSPTKNSTVNEETTNSKNIKISAIEFAQRQKLTSLEQLRIFGKHDAKAELIIPANAMYTLVRKVGKKATAEKVDLASAVKNGKVTKGKSQKKRRIIVSDSDSDSDETDILDLMRGIVIEQRIIKQS